MKKVKMLSLFAVATTLVVNCLYVAASEPFTMSSESTLSLLNLESVEKEYNIMLYDNDWNILNEFHTDGEMITYSYEENSICEIANTNGSKTRISTEGNVTTITNYYGEETINTFSIEQNTRRSTSSLEEMIALIDKAANESVSVNSVESNISICGDTYLGGYNLSTMCPSVWTENMGYDKFARPSTALDEDAIQAFLESKNSVLADDIVIYRKDENGNVYNTNITVTPSSVIHNASVTYHINPKIILGSLQREQRLITQDPGDFASRAFYFCMGCGARDDGDINSYTGFDTQVDEGTHLYLELWNEGYLLGQDGFPVSFAASDGTIQINNCGTYALFRYTPWKTSNRLFLDIMSGYWPDLSGVNGINWN